MKHRLRESKAKNNRSKICMIHIFRSFNNVVKC